MEWVGGVEEQGQRSWEACGVGRPAQWTTLCGPELRGAEALGLHLRRGCWRHLGVDLLFGGCPWLLSAGVCSLTRSPCLLRQGLSHAQGTVPLGEEGPRGSECSTCRASPGRNKPEGAGACPGLHVQRLCVLESGKQGSYLVLSLRS